MFVGDVVLRVVLIMECYNSHKHSQSPLTNSTGLGRLIFLKLPIHLNNIGAIFVTSQKKNVSV